MNMKSLMIGLAAAFAAAGTLVADEPEVVNYLGLEGAPKVSGCRDLSIDYPSPFTNALAWSDGQLPHYGPVYVVGKTNGANSMIWTPIYKTATTYDMFKTLILTEGSVLNIRHASGKAAIFNDLRVEGSETVSIWSPKADVTRLGGRLSIANGSTLNISAYNSDAIYVDSNVSGSGLIYFIPQSGTTAYKCHYRINGDNANFVGKIQVSTRYATPTFESSTSLTVTNAASLGGTLSGELSETYNALSLYKMSVLNVSGRDMTFPADSNRGLLVAGGGARINVPETSGTCTLNWPVTLAKSSHFYKEGAGHLVLGNTLHFLNKNGNFLTSSVSGVDCDYYIDIREGTIAVTDVHAMNGAHIAFSNETAFVMSVDLPDGALKTYGLRCDKARYAPLATTMPIRLRASTGAGLSEGRYVVSLVTVPNTYAADVESKLSIEELPARYRLLGITSAAAEGLSGATTFKAEIVRRGMTFCLR